MAHHEVGRWTALLAILTVALAGAGCQDPGDLVVATDDDDDSGPADDDDSGPADDDDTGSADDDDDTAPVDADGDGYTEDEDCDDHDAGVYPGAEEIPDGVDNDCDGYADELLVCEGVGDHERIQDAIDAAPDPGAVEVCPGTYLENLIIDGKRLAVYSTEGAAVTTVDGSGGVGSVWTVRNVTGAGAVIEGFTITGGQAAVGSGGGLSCSGSALEVTACTIRDNAAADMGGGIYATGCSGSISLSTVTGNEADQGGGVAVQGGALELSGNEIWGNTATGVYEYGGGGGVYWASQAALRDNVISANSTASCGGGVFVQAGSPEIAGNHVEDNTCADDGAGIFLYTYSGELHDNVFESNAATDDAGALRIFVSACTISDNEFLNNTGNDDGGAVKFSHYHSEFTGNYLEGNSTGDEGGALELDNDTTTVWDCTFVGNHARLGGALHSAENETSLAIGGSTFEGNTGDDCGGAIAVEDDAHEVTIAQSLFLDNQSSAGGALCLLRAQVTVAAVAITGNQASTGGALYVEECEGSISNVVAHDNAAPAGSAMALADSPSLAVLNVVATDNGPGPAVDVAGTGIASWTYGDVWGNAGGGFSGMSDPTGTAGNISVDPQFNDASNLDFTLSPASPCIDAGTPVLDDPDGSRSDMGAHGGPLGGWS